MNILRNILFAIFAAAALTLSVSAQKDEKRRPPKDPPKVEVPEKNRPPQNPPPKEQKPKKPAMAFVLVIDRKISDLA